MEDPSGATRLRERIAAAETGMKAKLSEARASFDHPGNKGDAAEDAFRQFLRAYLPRSFGVGHGEVLDRNGRRSSQTDVVVVTADHPFTFTASEPGLFFIEGVAAAAEVKSVLTSDELGKALKASRDSRTGRARR